MATDLEQLSVTLSAKIDDFKRGMQDAVRDFDSSANQIEQKNLQLTQSISRNMQESAASTKFLASALKQVLSVYAIEQFISAIKKANEAVADLGKQADDSRLSAQNIAGLHLAGIQEGAGTKEIDAALKHFTEQTKKTEEDARGLYRALGQVDPALVSAFRSAPTQTEKVNVLTQALNEAKNETQRFQVATNALGTDNQRVIAAFQRAGDDLNTLGQRARQAGIDIDDGITKRAQEAQKQLDLLSEVSADKLKTAFANLAPVLIYALNFMQKIGTAMGLIYDTAVRMSNLRGSADEVAHVQPPYMVGPDGTVHYASEIATPGGGPLPIEGPLPPRRPTGTGGSGGLPAYTGRENLQKAGGGESLNEYEREYNRLEKQTISLKGQAEALKQVGEEGYKAEAITRLKAAADEAGLKPSAALTAEINKQAEAYSQAKSAVDAVKASQDLIFQRAQLGRTADEQEVFSKLRGYHQDPDSEAGKALADQIRDIQNLTQGKEMASSFIKGLISDLENGVKAGKALENQLKRILEKLADKALDKLISGAFGGLGGLFGGGGGDVVTPPIGAPGAFGPGFASGGLVGRDGTPTWIPAAALRGARQFQIGGGVPAILHAGEIVLNQAQQKNVAASMSSGPKGPINLTHAPVINGTGLSKEEVFSVIQRSQKEFARQIGPIFSDWQRRYA
jgi:hypothetical protein